MKKIIFSIAFIISVNAFSLPMNRSGTNVDTMKILFNETNTSSQFISTATFLDAGINSLNSLNSLIKKENYRNKITSFNNPTSSDMGFNLENEIQTAL